MTSDDPGAAGTPPRILPTPPRWAAHTVAEDGGLTHELVSEVHPCLRWDRGDGTSAPYPTDVSVSVVDRPDGRHWSRSAPTLQVEGGSYTLAEARRLVTAIDGLLAAVEGAGPPPSGPQF